MRKNNKKTIKNYVEIYIKSDVNKIIKNNKKKLYKKKGEKIWGINIKAEFPKKPLIQVESNFDESLKIVANKLIKEIFKKLKY